MRVVKKIEPKVPSFIMEPCVSLKKFILSEEGATAIEYALLAALIATASIGAQTTMGAAVVQMYTNAVGTLSAAMS